MNRYFPHISLSMLLCVVAFGFTACTIMGHEEASLEGVQEERLSSPVPESPEAPEVAAIPDSPAPPESSITPSPAPVPTPESEDQKTDPTPIPKDEAKASEEPPPVASPEPSRQLLGEFPGIKTKWELMRKKLEGEIQEHNRKTQELQGKLQLMDQIIQNVEFTTTAFLEENQTLAAEFSIENRTPYAIKDISITCDQIAPTGTIIQSHTETLYHIIATKTRASYSPLSYGIKHPQTKTLKCQITNFTVHNPAPNQ